MSTEAVALMMLAAAYSLGGIPFGYLIGRWHGVDLFTAGSGNIGATNAGRVLGRRAGVLVFLLDFAKGAIPVAFTGPLLTRLTTDPQNNHHLVEYLRVGVATLAFLGHLFPIWLRFRGGKGVATGAGVICVLVPGPAAAAITTWLSVVLASRYVSLASLAAATALLVARLLTSPQPFELPAAAATLFCAVGAMLVYVKHRANLSRLFAHTESQISDGVMRQTLLRGLHVFALGLWFGSAAFFNFGTALPIFDSFKKVVADGPTDRTAYQAIIPAEAKQEQKDALASALAGAAVGPVFPRFFALQAVCAIAAVVTAWAWRKTPGTRVDRWRYSLLVLAAGTIAIGWPISTEVTRLRLARFDPNVELAMAAKAAFGVWHLVSLLLSVLTIVLVGAALALASKMPADRDPQPVTPT